MLVLTTVGRLFDPRDLMLSLVTHFLVIVVLGELAESAGVETGSWNRLTKSVVAWFPWKPNSGHNEDSGDMDDAKIIQVQAPNGASALICVWGVV